MMRTLLLCLLLLLMLFCFVVVLLACKQKMHIQTTCTLNPASIKSSVKVFWIAHNSWSSSSPKNLVLISWNSTLTKNKRVTYSLRNSLRWIHRYQDALNILVEFHAKQCLDTEQVGDEMHSQHQSTRRQQKQQVKPSLQENKVPVNLISIIDY